MSTATLPAPSMMPPPPGSHQNGYCGDDSLYEIVNGQRVELPSTGVFSVSLDKEIPFEGDWQVVPDLAVEVISPNDLFENVLAKSAEYFAHGVKLVWVIAPQAEVIYVYNGSPTIRVLTVKDDLDGGDVVPGFRLKIAELFSRTR